MPKKIDTIQRPWEFKPEYNTMQGQGRLVINPFYKTALWKKTRAAHLKAHPLCVECEKEGKVRPGRYVDHKKPINRIDVWDLQNGKYGHPTDLENLQTLCDHHNAVKTGKERQKK
jgi:5-methylcytosine-specific restriction endonuclease McrA